jgi:hypothetical protein
MLRVIFFGFLLIHGLIHLMGFVKEWDLAAIPQLNGPTLISLSGNAARSAGIGWLLATALCIGAGILFLMQRQWWWMPAGAAVIVSQVLIILYWHDAHWGTIPNVVLLLAALAAFGQWSFQHMVDAERPAFLNESGRSTQSVTREMIAGLPPVVRTWMEHTNIVGHSVISTVHLRQRGAMRTKPDGNWMAVEAEQYFTVGKPGFHWTADVDVAPLVSMYGRDQYLAGRGALLISLFGLIPVADSKGPEVDQGSMLRYLAETAWFPSAILHPSIVWEQLDQLRARATMSYGGITSSGVFTFNKDRDLVCFDAKRYYDRPEGATLEDWHIENDLSSIRYFHGIRMATRSTVSWKLASGDFTWFKLEVFDVEYNNP